MIRFIVRTGILLVANAVGLLVAAALLVILLLHLAFYPWPTQR